MAKGELDDEIEAIEVSDYQPDDSGRAKNWAHRHRDADFEEKGRKLRESDLSPGRKQTYHGLLLFWVAFQSTGTIYGDIGTSPLYVFSSTFTAQPSWDDLVGALSIIIWSLTLIVTVKYTFIILQADDDGQGGTFALYSLLARYVHIDEHNPKRPTISLTRYKTDDMKPIGRSLRSVVERSTFIKTLLKVVGVVGVSAVLADGVLTPAQSVLGAIQGISVANANISNGVIVGATCAILVLLFAVQPFGTSKLGTTFAPIVLVWLLFNAVSGIYNLAKFDHSVLKAFSPTFAISYMQRNRTDGWRSLGGLLLAFTGVEALFADLGAFSKRAIQISWLGLAYPCLLLAYIGQAAYIAVDQTGTAWSNPFFYTIPPGTLYFGLVIAILASIVASQAMITSSFQLLVQVMRLSYFPHIKVVHTSKHFHEQIYVPLCNWLLMTGTIIITVVYNNTTSLGNAYGVCVIMVTLITTCMTSLVAILVWRAPVIVVLTLFLVFGCLDGLYFSSALLKVPQGAWFTLLLAFLLSSIFILWRYGKEQQWTAEAEDKLKPGDVLQTSDDGTVSLTAQFGGRKVSNAHGVGIFFDKVGDDVPKVFSQFVRKLRSRPSIAVFFHIRPLQQPTVPAEERFFIGRTSIPSCYRLTLRHGYMDDVITPDLGKIIVDQIAAFIRRDHGADGDTNGDTNGSLATTISLEAYSPEIRAELSSLRAACEDQIVYVIGKEIMKVRRGAMLAGLPRWLLLNVFLFIRENTRAKMADLDIDVDSIVEVGFVKMI